MKECSQSLGHTLPFVAPSIVLVNTENSAKIVTNKPDSQRWPLVHLQGAQPHLHHLEHGLQTAADLTFPSITAIGSQPP